MTLLAYLLMTTLTLVCGMVIGYYFAIYRIRRRLESIEIEIEYEDADDSDDEPWIKDPNWWRK